MSSPKRSAWAAMMLAIAVVVTACGGKSNSPSQSPVGASLTGDSKSVTIGMWSAPDSLLPITNKSYYSTQVTNLIFPALVVMNDKHEWQGQLAKEWKASDDHTTFTFKLHENAKWSDGKPITAHDVAYTFAVTAHPDTPTTRRSYITAIKGLNDQGINANGPTLDIEGIKVTGDHELQISTKAPVDVDSFVERAVASTLILPKHVLETVKDLKGLDKAAFSMNPPVDGGPFHFVKYETGSHAELAANPDYWLGAPKLSKVFIKVVGQTSVAAAIQKGEIDFTTGAGTGEVPIVDWEKVSKFPNVTPVTFTTPNYQYMSINTQRPYFQNVKVRQGITTAINKELIVNRLGKGEAEVVATPINSVSKYYRPELTKSYVFDTAKAKQLLTEGGWDFSREIDLLVPTGNKVREDSADIIQQNLQAAGVKVKITKVDFPTRQARGAAGDFDLSLLGIAGTFDPDFSRQLSLSGGLNDGKYTNPKMEELFKKGILTADFQARKAIYDELQDLFVAEQPIVPLYAPKALVVVNKRVENLKIGAHGYAFNAHEWNIR